MLRRAKRRLRILDFDIENRPLSYLSMDFTTAEITAIAWSFVGKKAVEVRLLGPNDDRDMRGMLLDFVDAYNEADVVTGHYIRRHDLPIINGALLEAKLPPLGAKLTSDTKTDLVTRSGISASQENLAEMYGLAESKYHMSQIKWRTANRLTPEGIEQTRKRVVDDVKMHKALRVKLVEAGALKAPQVWRP